MNCTEKLPREIFAYLVRRHLEEDSNNKPILNGRRKSCDKLSLESPIIRSNGSGLGNLTDKESLKQQLAKSTDSSILTRQQAIQLEPFLREDIDRKHDEQLKGAFLEDGYTRRHQKNMQEDQLKDSIENEVIELSSVLDEMQHITGQEIFDDLKQLNLLKGSNALKKDLRFDPRKTLSQRTFSDRTLKLALTQLQSPPKLQEKHSFIKTLTDDQRHSKGVEGRVRAFSLEDNSPLHDSVKKLHESTKKSSFKDNQRPNFATNLE